MYEAVHAHPDGESDVARLVETAGAYGFDGVVVRNHSDERPAESVESFSRERVEERNTDREPSDEPDGGPGPHAATGLDVVSGIEIRAENPQAASGAVGNFRTDHTIVAIHGGTPAMNRFAVETDKVDVLAHPMAGDGDINHVMAKAAAKNGVRIEFDLGPVLRTSGGRRVRAIQSLRKLRELVTHYDAPHVVSADARSHLQLRAPRELAALGEQLGFTRGWIEAGLAEWGRLAARNRRIRSDSFVEPGVERGRYDEGSR